MTIRKLSGTIFLLAIAIISVVFPSLFPVKGDDYQQDYFPLNCLEEIENPTFYQWWNMSDAGGIELNDVQWEMMLQIPGVRIWEGYPDGWDVPDGIRGLWNIRGHLNGQPTELWIWGVPGDDEYLYVFAFDTTEESDSHGHVGIHPCGNGQIERELFRDAFYASNDDE